ncbi:MAG: T9SS type A sorting domain-containing protein [Flavobacteriales bacterium]|nr:T9SS type A sorting domain-containing protein [Flavobacteriales bacterium]
MKKQITFTIVLSMLTVLMHAQFDIMRNEELVFMEDGETLENPFVGGLTAPQISRFDADFDGDLDLFVFDRDGNRKLVFINNDDTPGVIDYTHAPELSAAFPDVKDWVLLRDFDCDGKQDLFTGFQSSIQVYRNTSTEEDGLQFELYNAQLQAEFDFGGGPTMLPLVCLTIDMPSITDYDGDGDLDIVTFTESATTIYFFENKSVDNGDCSLLEFECTNRCYGMLAESTEDNLIIYGQEFVDEMFCSFNVADPRSNGERDGVHAGGSLLSVDLDDNGLLDLIIGDVSFTNLTALYMEDAVDGQDSTVVVDDTFPAVNFETIAADVQRFPAGYYEDINNDGVSDLLIAPNTRIEADDDNSLWLYINEGTNTLPDFEFIQTDFLQSDMVEVGRGCYPVMFDQNGDGLKDLVLANKEYYMDVDVLPSQLALYLNTGTATNPEFTLEDTNWLDIPSLSIESIYPAFGDLDGDGDEDMILGEETGILHYFENTAGVGQPAEISLETPAIQGIDIGQFATPQLFDLDEDGLLDLLVGEKLGIVNYFRNTGTATDYEFTQMQGQALDSLGGVAAENYLGINGYSVPHMIKDTDGTFYLFVTNEKGGVQLYNGINDNLDGYFNDITPNLPVQREGDRAACWVEDINGDDVQELFYGIANGGLIFYQGDVDDSVFETTQASPFIGLYPNPTSGTTRVELQHASQGSIFVHDALGRNVEVIQLNGQTTVELDASQWQSGLYFVEWRDGTERHIRKLVINE